MAQVTTKPITNSETTPSISKRFWVTLQRDLTGYLFISPWLIGFLIWTLGPFIASFILSLTDYSFGPVNWVGLENYRTMVFDDSRFWRSLGNTIYYTALVVPLGQITALGLALLLKQRVRGINLFRTIFFLPTVIAGTASAFMWALVLNPRLGLINGLLRVFGIEGPWWLGDPNWIMPAFVLMSLWTFGGSMTVYLAALQSVPQDLLDAATVDGATSWKKLIYVTIPLITPTIFFLTVMNFIYSFQVFTLAYVLTTTRSGPEDAALFYMLYMFFTAFKTFEMGYASALAWVLFVLILVVTVVQMRLSGRWVYYEGEVK